MRKLRQSEEYKLVSNHAQWLHAKGFIKKKYHPVLKRTIAMAIKEYKEIFYPNTYQWLATDGKYNGLTTILKAIQSAPNAYGQRSSFRIMGSYQTAARIMGRSGA